MLHARQLMPADDVLFEMCEEPEGLSEWRLHNEIETYVRKLRAERSISRVRRQTPEHKELRGLFNQLLWPYGFRVCAIPGRIWN